MKTLLLLSFFLVVVEIHAEYTIKSSLQYAGETSISIRYASKGLHFWMALSPQNGQEQQLQGFLIDSPVLQFGSFSERGIYARLAKHAAVAAWSQTFTQKNGWNRIYEITNTRSARLRMGSFSVWQRRSDSTITTTLDTWLWGTDTVGIYSAILYSTQRKPISFDTWIIDYYPQSLATMHYALISTFFLDPFQFAIDGYVSTSASELPQAALRIYAAVPYQTNRFALLYSYYAQQYRDREGDVAEWNHEFSGEMRNSFLEGLVIARVLFRHRYPFAEFPARWNMDMEIRYQLNQSKNDIFFQEDLGVQLELYGNGMLLLDHLSVDLAFRVKNWRFETYISLNTAVVPEEEKLLQEKLKLGFTWKHPMTYGFDFTIEFQEDIMLGCAVSIAAKLGNIETKMKLTILENRSVETIEQFTEDIALTWSLHYTFKN